MNGRQSSFDLPVRPCSLDRTVLDHGHCPFGTFVYVQRVVVPPHNLETKKGHTGNVSTKKEYSIFANFYFSSVFRKTLEYLTILYGNIAISILIYSWKNDLMKIDGLTEKIM